MQSKRVVFLSPSLNFTHEDLHGWQPDLPLAFVTYIGFYLCLLCWWHLGLFFSEIFIFAHHMCLVMRNYSILSCETFLTNSTSKPSSTFVLKQVLCQITLLRVLVSTPKYWANKRLLFLMDTDVVKQIVPFLKLFSTVFSS